MAALLTPEILAILGIGLLSFGKELLSNKYVGIAILVLVIYYITPKGSGFNKVNNDKSKLKNPVIFYKNIADTQFNAMNRMNTDETILFSTLHGLNKDELIEVFNQFGNRQGTYLELTWGSTPLNIFGWYEQRLTDMLFYNEITNMKDVWQTTGLWI